MRKVFLLSALALTVAGCASQQGSPQVRDVSEARRSIDASSQYTVAQGDTLYGIAWHHGLDYRELASRNDIQPPYNIYPGQRIELDMSQGGGDTLAKRHKRRRMLRWSVSHRKPLGASLPPG